MIMLSINIKGEEIEEKHERSWDAFKIRHENVGNKWGI